jgi:hypothetical protein
MVRARAEELRRRRAELATGTPSAPDVAAVAQRRAEEAEQRALQAASVEVGRNSRIASSDPLVSTPVDGGADGVNTSAPLPQTPAEVQQIVAQLYPPLR